jgi:phenylacetate-CoA ligase
LDFYNALTGKYREQHSFPLPKGKKENYYDRKTETRSRARILEDQSKLFRKVIRDSYENSPFYRKYFRRLKLKPGDIHDIKQLQARKFFTTKEDLRKNYPFGTLAVPLHEVAEMHATSGTTGTPTLGVHTEKDLNDWGEIAARSLVMSGLTKRDIFQITPSLGMFSGGFGFYHGARKIGSTIVPASAGFSKRQIQFMIDFETTMFCAIVSYAFRLAEVADQMGIDLKKQTKVRKGVFGSEIWTREMKRKISDNWDLDPYDIYGFTELYGPGVGNDCSIHDGLHIWEDFFLVEVIDPKTLEPIGPEEEGELVFTTLRKEAMPLIRYRSRDISLLLDSISCDCGRTHRRYSEIKARSDDMIKVSGVSFWPSEIESVLLKEEGVGPEYRIKISRVESMDRLTIEVESRDKDLNQSMKESLARKLSKNLHDTLLFSPEVVVVEPNCLPRVEIGKAIRVVDERGK